MNNARSRQRCLTVALLLALPVAALAPATIAAGSALSIDDIVALLEAGIGESVILKQLELSGTRLVLTVEGLIQLKKAGASDTLLEALVASPARSTSEPDPLPVPRDIMQADATHAFRVYSEVDENGDPVVHITNLDKSGRRMGGEVEKSSYPNVVRPSERPPRREDYDDGSRSYQDEERGQVVVNVYPQDSGSSEPVRSEPYDRDYRGRYSRSTRAYYGLGRSDHHFHTPTCGHLFYYYGRYPYRYSGFRTIRHGGHLRLGHGVGIPFLGSIQTVPYSYSSAAARNQRVFGRR